MRCWGKLIDEREDQKREVAVIYLYSLLFLILTFIVWPVAVAYGWYRWIQTEREPSLLSKLSFIGHVFATFSLVLAVGSIFVVDTMGGSRFWDPTLLKIYRAGFVLSLVGLITAITGASKSNALRWSAPLAAFGAMLFWFASASGE
jgi:hypothetical protein